MHERKVRALFPSAVSWQGQEPRFSEPLYILAFTNRSGSNLLADYLRQTRKFRGFGEGLNWDEIRASFGRSPVESFPDYIEQLAGPPGTHKTWGIKASWSQIILLKRANILSMFSGVRIIHSIRQDLLGQAVSHWIAYQTNQWTSNQKVSGIVPEFSVDRIEQILMDIVRSNSYIDLLSRALDIPRYVVVYEELQDDPEGEIKRLAQAFGVDLHGWTSAEPRISRQRNNVNREFRDLCLQAWRTEIR